jgi:hypothetical protein
MFFKQYPAMSQTPGKISKIPLDHPLNELSFGTAKRRNKANRNE